MKRTKDLYREHRLLLFAVVVIVIVGAPALLAGAYGLGSVLLSFVQPEDVAQRTAFVEMVVGIVGGMVGLVGGITLVVGLLITLHGQHITQRGLTNQLDLTRQEQLTERFNKAIEHLGDEKIEIRLGRIAALKQNADQEESSDPRWQIIDILSSYVRRRASYKSNR